MTWLSDPHAVLVLRWLHVVGACTILGTGAGIAFFMVMAHRTKDAAIVAHTAGVVVIADWIFTATAVALQPVTGFLLARALGWRMDEGWIMLALMLYATAGAFWIPVVWMQHRMRDLARQAAATGAVLPDAYYRLYRFWFAFGFLAFAAVLTILWLMLARPEIAL